MERYAHALVNVLMAFDAVQDGVSLLVLDTECLLEVGRVLPDGTGSRMSFHTPLRLKVLLRQF